MLDRTLKSGPRRSRCPKQETPPGRWARRGFCILVPQRDANAVARRRKAYFRWPARCLFISNMLTLSLPPNTGFSLASARMSRLFFGS